MRVVVDTNVWVSGLIVPGGSPGRVLEAARSGSFELVASWELAGEIAAVLRRPRIRRYGITEADIEDVLFVLAPLLPSVEVDSPVRDPGDAPVIAAAIHGRAGAIVTGDADLLGDEDLLAWLTERGVEVLTPARFLDRLGVGATRRGGPPVPERTCATPTRAGV